MAFLPNWDLDYQGKCEISLTVEINGTERVVREVLVDTGFVGDSGLKLPNDLSSLAYNPQVTTITLGDGTPVDCFCSYSKIVAIGEKRLKIPIQTWFIFGQGVNAIGTHVLQNFKLVLDGPKTKARLSI